LRKPIDSFTSVTPIVESLPLDEAFAALTVSRLLFGLAAHIRCQIKQRCQDRFGPWGEDGIDTRAEQAFKRRAVTPTVSQTQIPPVVAEATGDGI
jgi:hypothetical protein